MDIPPESDARWPDWCAPWAELTRGALTHRALFTRIVCSGVQRTWAENYVAWLENKRLIASSATLVWLTPRGRRFLDAHRGPRCTCFVCRQQERP